MLVASASFWQTFLMMELSPSPNFLSFPLKLYSLALEGLGGSAQRRDRAGRLLLAEKAITQPEAGPSFLSSPVHPVPPLATPAAWPLLTMRPAYSLFSL